MNIKILSSIVSSFIGSIKKHLVAISVIAIFFVCFFISVKLITLDSQLTEVLWRNNELSIHLEKLKSDNKSLINQRDKLVDDLNQSEITISKQIEELRIERDISEQRENSYIQVGKNLSNSLKQIERLKSEQKTDKTDFQKCLNVPVPDDLIRVLDN